MNETKPYALIADHMIFFDDEAEKLQFFRDEQNFSLMKDAQIAYYEHFKTDYEGYISKLIGKLRVAHFDMWKIENAKKNS